MFNDWFGSYCKIYIIHLRKTLHTKPTYSPILPTNIVYTASRLHEPTPPIAFIIEFQPQRW